MAASSFGILLTPLNWNKNEKFGLKHQNICFVKKLSKIICPTNPQWRTKNEKLLILLDYYAFKYFKITHSQEFANLLFTYLFGSSRKNYS